MAKVGRRPIAITKEIIDKAESLAARGLTLEQIASCLGFSHTTLHEKKNEFVDFSNAIKRGQNKGISIIANALFESAKSGDKTAQIFYLKCRAHWKETNVTELSLTKQENAIEFLE